MDPLTGIWMPALRKTLRKDGVQFPLRPNYDASQEHTTAQNDEPLPEAINQSEEEEVPCTTKKTNKTTK